MSARVLTRIYAFVFNKLSSTRLSSWSLRTECIYAPGVLDLWLKSNPAVVQTVHCVTRITTLEVNFDFSLSERKAHTPLSPSS